MYTRSKCSTHYEALALSAILPTHSPLSTAATSQYFADRALVHFDMEARPLLDIDSERINIEVFAAASTFLRAGTFCSSSGVHHSSLRDMPAGQYPTTPHSTKQSPVLSCTVFTKPVGFVCPGLG